MKTNMIEVKRETLLAIGALALGGIQAALALLLLA